MLRQMLIVFALVSTYIVCPSGKANATLISGIVDGVFGNPGPASPPSVTTGIGTDSITWGIPCDGVTNCLTSPGGITPPNSLIYTPIAFETEIGIPVVIGTISYFNGTIQAGTEISQITLFLDATGTGLPLTMGERAIGIVNTPNTSDPLASADFLSISGAVLPESTFHVLESLDATATILATFLEDSPPDLDIEVVGFGMVTEGDGFITNPALVPEPATLAIFSFGLAGLGFMMRRRKLN